MKKKHSDKEAIDRAIQATLEANASAFERLKKCHRNLSSLFHSVSDALFVFRDGSLALANREADQILDRSSQNRASILRALSRIAEAGTEDFPIRLEFPTPSNESLYLRVRHRSTFSVFPETFVLLTAENRTRSVIMAAESKRIASDERRKIGRNLHDGLTQLLTSLTLQTAALAYAEQDESIRKDLESILTLSKRCLSNATELTQRLENSEKPPRDGAG